jgi:hypothetical protein
VVIAPGDITAANPTKRGFAEKIPSWVMACRETVEGEKAEKEEECGLPA